MKQILPIFLLITLFFTISCSKDDKEMKDTPTETDSPAASSEKYSDVIELMTEYIDIQEEYMKNLEKIEKAEEFVKVIEIYSASMAKIMPKMVEFSEKYPELDTEAPAELAELEERMEKISMQVQTKTPEVMMKYQSDPKVQEAFMKMATMMSSSVGAEE